MLDAMPGTVYESAAKPPYGQYHQTNCKPAELQCAPQPPGPVIGSDVVTRSSAFSHAGNLAEERGLG